MKNRNNALYAGAIALAALVVLVLRALTPQPDENIFSTDDDAVAETTMVGTIFYQIGNGYITFNHLQGDISYATILSLQLSPSLTGKIAYNEYVDGVLSSKLSIYNLNVGYGKTYDMPMCKFPSMNAKGTQVACLSFGKIYLYDLQTSDFLPYFDTEIDYTQGAPVLLEDKLIFTGEDDDRQAVYVVADNTTREIIATIPLTATNEDIVFSPDGTQYANQYGTSIDITTIATGDVVSSGTEVIEGVTYTVMDWEDTRLLVKTVGSDETLQILDYRSGDWQEVATTTAVNPFMSADLHNDQIVYATQDESISVFNIETEQVKYIGAGTKPRWIK